MNRLKTILWVAAVLAGLSAGAQNSADIINYINTYRETAIVEMQRSGVPAAIILAQGIHETEAGTSELVRKSNNHFGIKCKDSWTGSVVYHDDDERGECFRSYNNPMDSYKDHSDFLRSSSRYAFLFRLDPEDYKSWAYGLKKAGYATNIRYPQILIKLIEDYNLQQYTLIALNTKEGSNLRFADETADRNVASAKVNTAVAVMSNKRTPVQVSSPQYPAGEFTINNTRAIYSRSGTSLLAIANQYNLSLSRLLDFNDLKDQDVLFKNQVVFLQRKRKTGSNEVHIVREGETLYDICQTEGIRLESLQEFNRLTGDLQPAAGEKLYLQAGAPARPALAASKDVQSSGNSTVNNENAINNPGSPAVNHIVQTKETLYSISKKYNTDVDKIRAWNKLDSSDLKTGQELIIYKN